MVPCESVTMELMKPPGVIATARMENPGSAAPCTIVATRIRQADRKNFITARRRKNESCHVRVPSPRLRGEGGRRPGEGLRQHPSSAASRHLLPARGEKDLDG